MAFIQVGFLVSTGLCLFLLLSKEGEEEGDRREDYVLLQKRMGFKKGEGNCHGHLRTKRVEEDDAAAHPPDGYSFCQ